MLFGDVKIMRLNRSDLAEKQFCKKYAHLCVHLMVCYEVELSYGFEDFLGV